MIGKNQMHFDLSQLNRFENFFDETTGSSTSLVQLSPGRHSLSAWTADLGPVQILHVMSEGAHLWRDNQDDDRFHLGFLLPCSGRIHFLGQPINQGEIYVWQTNLANEFVTHGQYSAIEIILEGEFARSLGLALDDYPVRPVPEPVLQALTQLCLKVTDSPEWISSADYTPGRTRNSKDAIIQCIAQLSAFWEMQNAPPWSPTRAQKTAERARRQLDRQSEGAALSMTDLARLSGVSRRTLFSSFKEVYGIGPHKLNEITKLNKLRDRLQISDPGTQSITEIANELGFSELGRLSGRYKQLFLELPNETLRRKLGTGA